MTCFNARLRNAQHSTGSVLCVGLDPDWQRMPACVTAARSTAAAVKYFNTAIIRATAPYASAYKLNFAFYEALGPYGYQVLHHTLQHIPSGAIAIADAKRGDIGNTARQYAHAILADLDFDACTVSPYMGRDAVAPFLRHRGKAAFVLARTSNASARDFQEVPWGSKRLYHLVAQRANEWDQELAGTAGLVVGATAPNALSQLRTLCPTLPFLIPGMGAQGGQASAIAAAATGPVIISSSRNIIYASDDEDFAERAADAARKTRDLLAQNVPI